MPGVLGTSPLRSFAATCIALAVAGQSALAQALPDCTVDAMLVFDGSGSMAGLAAGLTSEKRIVRARRAVREAAPGLSAFRRVGLMVYGPGGGERCTNLSVRFPPRMDAAPAIIAEIETLRPRGQTPLTDAVRQAAEVLEYRNTPGIVVLVTDGRENCGGAPCEMARRLAQEAADLTIHVIGFQLPQERRSTRERTNLRKRDRTPAPPGARVHGL